jgi:hypothetical protein
MNWYRIGIIISIMLIGESALAQETGEAHDQTGHEKHGHRHHIGMFVGGTYGELSGHHEVGTLSNGHSSGIEKENAFTLGVDYQFRLYRFLGLGGFYDHAFGDFRTTVVAPGLFIRPVEKVQILAAPGVELHEGENVFVFRLGFYYEFHINRLSLAPTAAVDFVYGKEVFVYGLTFGFGF